MPRRWTTQTRSWAYKFLVLRDGEFCQVCGNPPITRFTLDIDHLDGKKNNNDESNLRLLCRRCNVSLDNTHRPSRSSVQRERENPHTRVCKEAIPYHEGSAEMQANYLFEVDYRSWLLSFVIEHGFITKREAVNAGAEVVGCNPTTSSKYLSKLTSLAGPLNEAKDMLGEVVIVLNGYNPHKESK